MPSCLKLHVTHCGSGKVNKINIQTWCEAFGTQTVAVLLLSLDAFSLLLLPRKWFQNYPCLNNPIRPFLCHLGEEHLKYMYRQGEKTRNTCNQQDI